MVGCQFGTWNIYTTGKKTTHKYKWKAFGHIVCFHYEAKGEKLKWYNENCLYSVHIYMYGFFALIFHSAFKNNETTLSIFFILLYDNFVCVCARVWFWCFLLLFLLNSTYIVRPPRPTSSLYCWHISFYMDIKRT